MNEIPDTVADLNVVCRGAISQTYRNDVKEIEPIRLRTAADTPLEAAGSIELLIRLSRSSRNWLSESLFL